MTEIPLTLTDAARALRDRELSSVDLVTEMIGRADALDAELGVYLARMDEYALVTARRADAELAAGIDRGPLHGIPIGVKDILAMAEGPTTANSLILDPAWGEGRDAIVVERLKAAGAVITGKLTTMEFAIGLHDLEKPFPRPRNPWDTERWPGGSSSGTGAGVAAGLFLAGIGTDTGGSIRIPAAYCGTSGLMPTFGRVPNAGCVPLGYSLDHIGPLARSARDCGSMLAAIAGGDPRDPYAVDGGPFAAAAVLDGAAPLTALRIGVERANHLGGELEDPAAAPAFERAVAVLKGLGAAVTEVEIPHYAETVTAQMVTMVCEAFAYHRCDMQSRWTDYYAATRTFVGSGALFSGADYVQAQRVRRVAQRALAALFGDLDVIVTPTAVTGAPSYQELEDRGVRRMMGTICTPYWDAVGNPVLVVPMGFTAEGMPLSLQLAAAPFAEATLLRAGEAFQAETDFHLQRPPVALASLA
ncbi:MAG TPA: amidase [Solirubrobacteraceae bacterium]|jgi:aspartyl-tRNA(Asn)/glutamyl-tRNA(Gln) amidotransferase subunit A|nr:amidase [Solirubrobacteraceae bacterium]